MEEKDAPNANDSYYSMHFSFLFMDLLQIIFCSCVVVSTSVKNASSFSRVHGERLPTVPTRQKNKLGDGMIKELLNSVIEKIS